MKNKLLYSRKSGFRSLHSTLCALLDMTNNCCFNIDRGMAVNRGTVDYKILLKKLEFSGFEGRTLSWFHLYLANRQQVCFANGVTSTAKIACVAGVQRGGRRKVECEREARSLGARRERPTIPLRARIQLSRSHSTFPLPPLCTPATQATAKTIICMWGTSRVQHKRNRGIVC